MENILEFTVSGRMKNVAAAILGDIVLDRYLTGSSARVSREAPIPVVVCDRETDNLGGAGNVVMNLRGLGCRAFLAGAVGCDEGGARVRARLREAGVEAELFDRLAPTITKTRLICGAQQVARFDRETITPPAEPAKAAEWLRGIAGEIGAVVLSDYGTGFCSPELSASVIETARAAGVPVLVDPRGSDWRKYRGATAATPNLAELSAVCGAVPNEDGAVAEAGERARREAELEWLLVTRSSKGMTLIGGRKVVHLPARPVEVFDVSGAGDTVIACLAAGMAAGFSIEESTRFANEAAQIVVTKSGTYPISAADLSDLAPDSRGAENRGRLVSRGRAAAVCGQWKSEGKRVVFTNGCFDVLHAGHADSLERARALGDRLIVGLNSDRSVRALKGGGRPVNRAEDRARLLAALRPVDLVVIFDEDTPAGLLSELRPHVLAKGGDYKADELPGREYVEEVVILPLVEGLSTTETLLRQKRANS